MESQNEAHNETRNDKHELTLEWMRECVRVTRRKTDALVRNDLAAIEDCLEEEALLVARWSRITAKELSGPSSIRESLKSLADEIQAVNRTNARLVESGMDLSRTLLDVIHPPTNYGPLIQGAAPTYESATQSIISVEG